MSLVGAFFFTQELAAGLAEALLGVYHSPMPPLAQACSFSLPSQVVIPTSCTPKFTSVSAFAEPNLKQLASQKFIYSFDIQ